MSLLDLPSELLRLVFSFVPPNVLPSLCLVHSKFNDILQDDFIWRQIILQQGKLHRSSFRHSYVQYNTNPDEDSFETINATLDPVFTSPSPYQSYHELYVKVFKDYAWMLGTFAGNAQWTGSVIEVFYNHKSGYIEGRRLHGSAIFTNAKYFSLDNDVIWRDFDPVLQAWQEPLFRCGPGVVQEAFAAQLGRSVGITDKATIDSMAYNNIWPTLSVPASERIIVDQAPALARLGNGFEDFSDNLMTISRPVLGRSLIPIRAILQGIPRHVELYYRLPPVAPEPPGFHGHSGLFMGDYSAHGPELIYLYYPTPTSLHAVKIEGDPNVPRGELTWKIDDLTTPVRICTEREWPGGYAFSGKGQISPSQGFKNPTWIDTEVILFHKPKPDRALTQGSPNAGLDDMPCDDTASVALWWKDMVHISRFHKILGINDRPKDE